MNMVSSPVCVYCGAASGKEPEFAKAADQLGGLLGVRGIELIYGGGRAGLMGTIADAALRAGGTVTGVITQQLVDKEIAHPGITRLVVVNSMHERKQRMADLARGFIAMPGGVGTLDELFEILAWAQLGLHDHPVGMLNVNGFYDHLLDFLNHALSQRFLRIDPAQAIIVDEDPERLLDRLARADAIQRRAWGNE